MIFYLQLLVVTSYQKTPMKWAVFVFFALLWHVESTAFEKLTHCFA
jgi:hypothetical protein